LDEQTLNAYFNAMTANRNRRQSDAEEESREVIFVEPEELEPRWQPRRQRSPRQERRRQGKSPLSFSPGYNAGGLGRGIYFGGQLVSLKGLQQNIAENNFNQLPQREEETRVAESGEEGSDSQASPTQYEEVLESEEPRNFEETAEQEGYHNNQEVQAHQLLPIKPKRQPVGLPTRQYTPASYLQPPSMFQIPYRPFRERTIVYLVPYPVPVDRFHQPRSYQQWPLAQGLPTSYQPLGLGVPRFLPAYQPQQFPFYQPRVISQAASYYQRTPLYQSWPQVTFSYQRPAFRSKQVYNQGFIADQFAAVEDAAESYEEEAQKEDDGRGKDEFVPTITHAHQQGQPSSLAYDKASPRLPEKVDQRPLFRGQTSTPSYIYRALGTLKTQATEIQGVVVAQAAETNAGGSGHGQQNGAQPFYLSNIDEGALGWHANSNKLRAAEDTEYMI
jgi:hypothetical protein